MMVLNSDISAFCENIKITKPPYYCPIESCNRIYKSFVGIQYHMCTVHGNFKKNFKSLSDLKRLHHSQIFSSNGFESNENISMQTKHISCSKDKVDSYEVSLKDGHQFNLLASQKLKVSIVEKTLLRDDIDMNIQDDFKPICTKKHMKNLYTKSEIKHDKKPFKILNSIKTSHKGVSNKSLNLKKLLPQVKFSIKNSSCASANFNLPPSHYFKYEKNSNRSFIEKCNYCIDEKDLVWIELVNENFKTDFDNAIDNEKFEKSMHYLENNSFFVNGSAENKNNLADDEAVCNVCIDGKSYFHNRILFCDMCNLAVHQECYGIPYVPEGQWLCRKCLFYPSKILECCLCPNRGTGAFKQVSFNSDQINFEENNSKIKDLKLLNSMKKIVNSDVEINQSGSNFKLSEQPNRFFSNPNFHSYEFQNQKDIISPYNINDVSNVVSTIDRNRRLKKLSHKLLDINTSKYNMNRKFNFLKSGNKFSKLSKYKIKKQYNLHKKKSTNILKKINTSSDIDSDQDKMKNLNTFSIDKWAHVACASWIPEITFSNTVFLEPIEGIEKIPKARWRLACCVCNTRWTGACIQCYHPNCYSAFHVTCALNAGLFVRVLRKSNSSHLNSSLYSNDLINNYGHNTSFMSLKRRAYCSLHMPTEDELKVLTNEPLNVSKDSTENLKKDSVKTNQLTTTVLSNQKLQLYYPNISNQCISELAKLIQLKTSDKFLEKLINYWRLKRHSVNGIHLIRNLQNENSYKINNQVNKINEKSHSSEQVNNTIKKRKLSFDIDNSINGETSFKRTRFLSYDSIQQEHIVVQTSSENSKNSRNKNCQKDSQIINASLLRNEKISPIKLNPLNQNINSYIDIKKATNNSVNKNLLPNIISTRLSNSNIIKENIPSLNTFFNTLQSFNIKSDLNLLNNNDTNLVSDLYNIINKKEILNSNLNSDIIMENEINKDISYLKYIYDKNFENKKKNGVNSNLSDETIITSLIVPNEFEEASKQVSLDFSTLKNIINSDKMQSKLLKDQLENNILNTDYLNKNKTELLDALIKDTNLFQKENKHCSNEKFILSENEDLYIEQNKKIDINKIGINKEKTLYNYFIRNEKNLHTNQTNNISLHISNYSDFSENSSTDEPSNSESNLETLKVLRKQFINILEIVKLVSKREECKRDQIIMYNKYIVTKLNSFSMFLHSTLDMIEDKDTNKFFTQPVDVTEVLDYLDHIAEPMDFSTMRHKIDSFCYSSLQGFEDDLNLIINNCLIYNAKGTIYYNAALRLKTQSKRIMLLSRKNENEIGFDLETGMHLNKIITNSTPESNNSPIKYLPTSNEDQIQKLLNRLDIIQGNDC